MRKIFLTFIVFAFAHIVSAQNKQTVVVRPETYREKQERGMRDVAEFLNDLGALTSSGSKNRADCLNKVKSSRYSVFVNEKLADWKKKGDFEKTADWQKRLQDSAAIKKAEIQESAIDDYAKSLNVLEQGYYSFPNELNDWFYDSKGQYNADKEVLVVNTFWGNIPIPIPLDEAKNMQNISYLRKLEARFFIQNDQLALLLLTCGKYIYENPSQSAQIYHEKRRELEQKRRLQEEEQVRLQNTIFEQVEQMPQFPGGEKEMYAFMRKEMTYPPSALEERVQGRVVVRFVVGANGGIREIKVVQKVDPRLDEEAVRLVKQMPKWMPAKDENGAAVSVYHTLPVIFKINDAGSGGTGSASGIGNSRGAGYECSLEGRGAKTIEKPKYVGNQEGTVIISIGVDKKGNVVSASIKQRGTTISDSDLRGECIKAAYAAKFTDDAKAINTVYGEITYQFRQQQ